jgi:hypothetical protein
MKYGTLENAIISRPAPYNVVRAHTLCLQEIELASREIPKVIIGMSLLTAYVAYRRKNSTMQINNKYICSLFVSSTKLKGEREQKVRVGLSQCFCYVRFMLSFR